MSQLLNQADNVCFKHEPWKADKDIMKLSYYDPGNDIIQSMLANRFEALFKELPQGTTIYGESNSFLRYNARWLKERFNCRIIHIIRNGRDVVRSIYGRTSYTPYDHMPIIPKNDDPYSHAWSGFDRFQKICWYWRHTNQYLEEASDFTVRFEDLISNYETFNKIFEAEGISVEKSIWENEIGKPKNSSKPKSLKKSLKRILLKDQPISEQLPLPKDWGIELEDKFQSICQNTMLAHNYPIESPTLYEA